MLNKDDDLDFHFMLPFNYYSMATPEARKRGILTRIELCQEDSSLSAVRMTFNNGLMKAACGFGKLETLNRTINFEGQSGQSIKNLSLCYSDTNVTRLEFNRDIEKSASASK